MVLNYVIQRKLQSITFRKINMTLDESSTHIFRNSVIFLDVAILLSSVCISMNFKNCERYLASLSFFIKYAWIVTKNPQNVIISQHPF